MSRAWQICLPFRTKSDSLAAVGSNIRALADAEDRATTAQLILVAAEAGCHTAGELLDVLEELERLGATRKALDTLRRKAGLETATDIEQREWRSATQSRVAPLHRTRILQCAADGCEVVPRDRTTMLATPVACRRWWCAEHRHLAAPGDDEPITHFESTASGGLKIVTDSEPAPLPGVHPGDAERFAQEARDVLAAFERLTRPESEQ